MQTEVVSQCGVCSDIWEALLFGTASNNNNNNNNIHLYGAISNLKLLFGATNNVNKHDQLGTFRCKIIESLQVCDIEQMAF